ncbi:MAG: DUF2231 domain-containing protein [Cytophagaceae bacterium]
MSSFHPFVVHFPLALFITASFFALVGLFYRRGLFKEIVFWQNIIGMVFVCLAIYSGMADADALLINHEVEEIVAIHKKNGMMVAIIFGSLTLWLAIRRKLMSTPEYASIVVFLMIGCIAVIYQAHVGSKLVYKKGLGVEAASTMTNSIKK